MKRYRITFRPCAGDSFGSIAISLKKLAMKLRVRMSIELKRLACLLRTFPERGTKRNDIRQGLRTMGFERRATIASGENPTS